MTGDGIFICIVYYKKKLVIFLCEQHGKAKIYTKPQYGTDRQAAKLQRVGHV